MPDLSTLAGVVLGWAITQANELLRRRREGRSAVGRVLADLMDLRHRLVAVEEVLKFAQVNPAQEVALRNMLATVLPGLDDLSARYEQGVTHLGETNPLLAFRLRFQTSFPAALNQLRAAAAGGPAEAVVAWQHFETVLGEVARVSLDKLIRELAWRHGWLTWWRFRRGLIGRPMLPPEVAQIFSVLKKQGQSLPGSK